MFIWTVRTILVFDQFSDLYVNFNQKEKSKKKIEQIISRYIYKVVTPVKKDKYDSDNNPIIDKSGKKDYRPVLYQSHKDSRIDKECQIVSRKDFYYYSKSKKDFYKMSFNTFQSYKAFAKAIRIFSKNNKSIKKTKWLKIHHTILYTNIRNKFFKTVWRNQILREKTVDLEIHLLF